MASNDEMSSLARVAAALTFGEPDRVPVAPLVCGAAHRFSGQTYADWSRCEDVEAMVQGHLDSIEFLGLDGVVMLVDLTVEAGDFGCEVRRSLKFSAARSEHSYELSFFSIDQAIGYL